MKSIFAYRIEAASSRRNFKPWLAFLCITITAQAASARTWRVNKQGTGDAPTIRAAIDSAIAGDEILVGPGTYTEPATFIAPDSVMLALKPEVALRSEEGPERTTLWTETATDILCSPAGTYHIEGFKIIPVRKGIQALAGARPRILNCIFFQGSFNPAVECSFGIVDHCFFIGHGGSPSPAVIVRETTVSNCVFERNNASSGAILWVVNSTIADCIFRSNIVSGDNPFWAVVMTSGSGSISRCLFANNRGASFASVINGSYLISESVFADNEIAAVGGSAAILERCTILNGPVTYYAQPTLNSISMNNCIVAWSTCPSRIGPGSGRCNDIFASNCGGFGTDEFRLDPQFCAVDPSASLNFSLQEDSPCAPGNHPGGIDCGLIGAGSVQCGSVGVQPTTWSDVKWLYR